MVTDDSRHISMECARSDCQRLEHQSIDFRPILSQHTGTRRNKFMPMNSQVGWCSPCWNRKKRDKSIISTIPYLLLLQAQIMVWARDFNIEYFQVSLEGVTFATVTVDKAMQLFHQIRHKCTEKGALLADGFRIRPFRTCTS